MWVKACRNWAGRGRLGSAWSFSFLESQAQEVTLHHQVGMRGRHGDEILSHLFMDSAIRCYYHELELPLVGSREASHTHVPLHFYTMPFPSYRHLTHT